ncbi:alanine--tRNA ligase-related protein [Acinetobacter shaoyimingii]|uniref:Alanine--tRNA ligase n=1 Tax=Acinetobacter shaoyimingii TaxID=2715164 RepID=A0A6G8RYQ4_9GAMM|nr:alanyl-tRNA editing protein [Acinetobacter shaoyimingii]QIO06980.1 alanyl-tRNA editing protein [Acinetobacter shaoyimingii]
MLETMNEYYDNYFKFNGKSKIIRIENNKLYFDKTIFYAESGGQESDLGLVKLNDVELNISNVQYEKENGLWKTAHYVETEEDLNQYFQVNDEINLVLNTDRRNNLSAYHTASHLLFIAAEKVRNGIQKSVIGCHIKEDSARFDFITDLKFTEDELNIIANHVNSMISNQLNIRTFLKNEATNERVWECDGFEIPCGGTHLTNTGFLEPLKVKRKGIGKGKERLICISSQDNIIHGELGAHIT